MNDKPAQTLPCPAVHPASQWSCPSLPLLPKFLFLFIFIYFLFLFLFLFFIFYFYFYFFIFIFYFLFFVCQLFVRIFLFINHQDRQDYYADHRSAVTIFYQKVPKSRNLYPGPPTSILVCTLRSL